MFLPVDLVFERLFEQFPFICNVPEYQYIYDIFFWGVFWSCGFWMSRLPKFLFFFQGGEAFVETFLELGLLQA